MVSKKFDTTIAEPVSLRLRSEASTDGPRLLRSSQSIQDEEVKHIEDDESQISSDEDDSDSDAPEEEGVSEGTGEILKLEEERARLEKEAKLQEKLKRRELTARFQKQQEEKRLKEEQKLQKQSVSIAEEDDEIPDFLPEDLLEEARETAGIVSSKHVNFTEDPKEIRKALKKARIAQLKQMKKLNTKSLKKGPVTVSVLGMNRKLANNKTVLSVPVGETKVLSKRDKWLKRKSLGKQRV